MHDITNDHITPPWGQGLHEITYLETYPRYCPREIPPGGNPAERSNILKAKICILTLTRTPDPNRPTGVTFGEFSLGLSPQGAVSRGAYPCPPRPGQKKGKVVKRNAGKGK